MADGALSWLALVAARALAEADEVAGSAAGCSSPAAWPATGPTPAPTAGSRSARSSRSSGPRGVAASAARISSASSSRRPAARRHADVEAIFAARTRAEWEAFAAEHECCLEPVLDLDGGAVLASSSRARGMVVGLDQPGAARAGLACSARRSSSRARRRTPTAYRDRQLGEHSEAVLREAGYDDAQISRAHGGRRGRGPAGSRR